MATRCDSDCWPLRNHPWFALSPSTTQLVVVLPLPAQGYARLGQRARYDLTITSWFDLRHVIQLPIEPANVLLDVPMQRPGQSPSILLSTIILRTWRQPVSSASSSRVASSSSGRGSGGTTRHNNARVQASNRSVLASQLLPGEVPWLTPSRTANPPCPRAGSRPPAPFAPSPRRAGSRR